MPASEPAAKALGKAQEEFEAFGLSIKVFDCYRPQPAVDHFMRWTRDVEDIAKKAEFYRHTVVAISARWLYRGALWSFTRKHE